MSGVVRPGSASAGLHRLQPVASHFVGAQLPIYKASTVYFEHPADMRVSPTERPEIYTYGLYGSPAQRDLAQQMAALEGGAVASLYPSGLAAIAHLNLSLLQQGDVLLLPHNVYSPAHDLARSELARFGIGHALYDPLDPESLRLALARHPRTKLVWLEAAGSVTLEFPDVSALVALCREAGVLSALDNTWGAGLAFNAFALGLDYTVHALTKYPGGGADVLMGSIVAASAPLHARVQTALRHYGWGTGADDVYLVLRSLATLELRYRAQDAAARQLAQWMAHLPQVRAVLHPALDPEQLGGKWLEGLSHANWLKVCGKYPGVRAVEAGGIDHLHAGSAAALFTVVLQPRFSQQCVDAFVQALQLFKMGYSWAGPISLVVPYSGAHMAALRPHQQAHWQAQGPLLRFAVGLEPLVDLQSDITQALTHLCL